MNITDYKDRLESIKEQLNDCKNRFLSDWQTLIGKSAAPLFEKYKWLDQFGWCMYTPYFCDGDPCYFTVYADYPYINEYSEYTEYDSLDKTFLEDHNISKEIWSSAQQDISNFANNILGEDLLKFLPEGRIIFLRNGSIIIDEDIDHE